MRCKSHTRCVRAGRPDFNTSRHKKKNKSIKITILCVFVLTYGCPSGVFSGMAMVKVALVNCGGLAPATTDTTAGALRLPSRSAAMTVSRYSLSCCRGRPVVRTWPFFLSTSKRPSPPADRTRDICYCCKRSTICTAPFFQCNNE